MKLVWENGGATVQAPKKLRSAWPNAPEENRGNFNRIYSIGTVGAWQIQADIKEHQEQQQQKKRDAVMDLFDGWIT
tara:strand:- start:2188 stop:2415 length:228 start_codon:yes stop_codon:yes gene_type:complete